MKAALFLLIFTFAVLTPACSRKAATSRVSAPEISVDAVNINTAGKLELQRIPYIGERLAEDIIAHREKFGPFRRAEHLLLIQGVSDRRFREIRHLVRVN